MTRYAKIVISGVVAFVVASSGNVASADYLYCCGDEDNSNNVIKWSNTNQTFKILTGWGWGRAMLFDAAARWNDVQGSAFTFNLIDDDDNSITTEGDGNEIGWYGDAPDKNPVAVTATTHTKCETCDSWECGGSSCTPGRLQEADIYFYANDHDGTPRNWIGYPSALIDSNSLNALDIATVASHELGHALGLKHTDHGMARMESHMPGGGWYHDNVPEGFRVTPLATDNKELSFIYPGSGSNVELVAINHQHRWGTSDPNEDLAQSMPLSWHEDNGSTWFPANRVSRSGSRKNALPGDTVDIRICVQNTGNQSWDQEVPIRIRLSTDTTITTSDVNVGGNLRYLVGTFGPRIRRCDDVAFTVPNISPGSYVIGVTLDTGTGDENNTTILNRRLNIL